MWNTTRQGTEVDEISIACMYRIQYAGGGKAGTGSAPCNHDPKLSDYTKHRANAMGAFSPKPPLLVTVTRSDQCRGCRHLLYPPQFSVSSPASSS